MTTYSVRCRNSACRHRRVSKIHPGDYKRIPRCPECGQHKGWRIEQRRYNRVDLCSCNQVPLYPHRKAKHPCCDFHPRGEYNQLKRRGVSDDDMPLELLGTPCNSDIPPF